ncbi:MAG TPA: SBBP repeat-containing protein [Burkholderiales bacterium]|nr:SBBP repeat-containing protein [Burkholderiales bacterium]
MRFVLFPFLASFALPAAAAADARLSESYGKLPLQFEANRGQTDKQVRFLSRGPGYGLYLTEREAVLVLSKKRDAQASAKSVALRMSLVGAASKSLVSGRDALLGKANYFIGRDPSKWRSNVPTYAKVHYQNVYPGIDLVYYGNQHQLEYDFVVAPGADPSKIVLGFKGANKLEIDAEGDLVLHATGGDLRQHKPVVYQEIDGVRREIAGGYVRKGAGRVGFEVAAYDTTRPLVIDPVVLSYSTYLGGSGFGNADDATSIAVDKDGNAYVTGSTRSNDFPTTAGAFGTTLAGSSDAFVTKLNPTGTELVYSSYFGGNGSDGGMGIAVDAGGNAYVTGFTNSVDFPTTPGAFSTSLNGGGSVTLSNGTGVTPDLGTPPPPSPTDAFVTKLDATGSVLAYSTYLGGSGNEGITKIAIDKDGSAYVAGTTASSNFPTTPGAFQTTFAGGGEDVFVTKLDPTGSFLAYSTYLGGSGNDNGAGRGGIAVDADGNAYLTGTTESTDFPTTPGAFQLAHGPARFAAYVAKVDPSGSALIYSTYLGGSGGDRAFAIAIDDERNAYVTGDTASADFPTTAGAFQTTFKGPAGILDAFVTKLNPTGSVLIYSTYLGGSTFDSGGAIAVDSARNAYVTGFTDSTDFPTAPGAFQTTHGSQSVQREDAFVTKLDPAGSTLVYSSFLGGNGSDGGGGIAIDGDGNAYVTGDTQSSNFPTTPGAFQPTGGSPKVHVSAFIAKIVEVTRSEESAATDIGFWTTFGAETGSFSGGNIVASNFPASTALFSFKGTALSWIGVKCNVCGIAAVSVDGGAPTTVDTAGPNAPGSLASEPVFSVSGLAAGTIHVIAIIVTGRSSSGGRYVAVDAFDVTAGGATPLLPLPVPGLLRIPGL